MAGAAAARSLTPRIASLRGRFEFSTAADEDEPDIRRLLREPLPGRVSVSLEREPDIRIAARAEGDVHQTIVARETASGAVAAIASRSVRDAFVNGRLTRLGYLGQLRVAAGSPRSRSLFEGGFEFCRSLHESGDARLYLTSLVADNGPAHRLLLRSGWRFAPRLRPAGSFSTLVVPRQPGALSAVRSSLGAGEWHRRRGAPIQVVDGSPALIDDIAACLQRYGERRQFAPLWTARTLLSPTETPGLAPEHFIVAIRGSRVIGCVARWDQRHYKQVVVRGYGGPLRRWRRAINAGARLLGTPRLPDVGRRLEFVYLSHFAVDSDDGDVAVALLAAARQRLPADIDYVITGLASSSVVLRAVRRLPHREYRSELFVACWPDGEELARTLDTRDPHPEVALL